MPRSAKLLPFHAKLLLPLKHGSSFSCRNLTTS
jgi:hypothetical protein